MSQEELLKGRQLITHLELIQFKFFNGRQEWTTIELEDLRLYMAYTIFGSPCVEDEYLDGPDDIFSYYRPEEKNYILDVFETVKDNIVKLIGPIKVGITFTHSICKNKCEVCWHFPTKDIHQWCLFRVKTDDGDDDDGGATYIDLNHKRTYKNWTDYLENNNLPEGVMFHPPLGYYDESKCLVHTITPASKIISKTLKKIDTVGNVINVVSNVFMAGGLIFPMFAPLLIPSALMGVTANMFTVTRSVDKIIDLKTHKESLTSSLGRQYLIDLAISLLSTVTTISNGVRVFSELRSSKMLVSSLGSKTIKTLSTINSSVCVLECTMEVVRLTMQIKNKKKLTIKDFLTLRLDLFLAIGQLWPTNRVKHIFEVILTQVTAGIYFREVSALPYHLSKLWLQGVGFIKKHFIEFMSQVTKFLTNTLTKERVLFAYGFFRKLIDSYLNKRKSLNVSDLLKHIVDNTSLKCNEEGSVKTILCGQYMLDLLHKSQMNIDFLLIKFCIDYIMEKATILNFKFNESVELLRTSDLDKIKKEFCIQYMLEDCCMSQYVLHSIKESSNNIESFLDAYRTYMLKSDYNKDLVRSENNGFQSLDTYQVSVPSDNLDLATCVSYAQAMDSNNHNFKDYKFIKTESNISILFSVEWLSIKMIFFHVHKINRVDSLNISFYQNGNLNVTPQLTF